MFGLSAVVFLYAGVFSQPGLPLGGIRTLHETQEWLCRLENVTGASVNIVARKKNPVQQRGQDLVFNFCVISWDLTQYF